ncbi:MAG: hypothetical protein C3F15_03355 [Holophagae bacterium]|nr:MAG: hypothetical protein C3F15_03355 [Holophagae bacterium]
MSGTLADTWQEFPFLLTDRRDNATEYEPATGGEPSTGMPALLVWGGRTPLPFPIPRSFPLSLPRRPCPQVSRESR